MRFWGQAGLIAAIFLFGTCFSWHSTLCASKKPTASAPDNAFFALDFGGYVPNLDQQVKGPEVVHDLTSHVSGYFRARLGIALFSHLFIEPALGSLLPWKSSADGSTKIFPFTFGLDFSYPLFSFLRLRLGPGVYSTVYTPGSDAVSLNNGTSTATFYTPNRFAATFQFQIQGGIQILFSNTFSLLLEGIVMDPGSDALSQFNGSACLGINL